MKSSIASTSRQIARIKLLQWIPIGYLALLTSISLLSWFPFLGSLMVALIYPVYMLIFWVLLSSVSLFLYTSVVFFRASKIDTSIQKFLTKVQVFGLATVLYVLSFYFVWGTSVVNQARTEDHNLVIALESSPVILGLVLLAAHVFAVRRLAVNLKTINAA